MSQIIDLINNFAASCRPGSGGNILSLPTWYKYLEGEVIAGKCSPKVIFPNDIGAILLAVFEIILRLGGVIAIGFVIFSGFQLILAQGEPDRVKGARSTIINALIGLVITIFSVAVVNLIARNIN